MEIGTVRQVDIDQEMQVAYLDYAMSVIVARALPDVRDGLKPVHRRILYAMHDMNLYHTSPYKKSARIVGEVLGKYHPHGDAAVYESMVRMAQDFSMRYLLVDGQGNFGSIDGDSAAAMRYTEARQAALSEEMLRDIGKNTVDFGPNFDGSLREPLVLPAAFPNLIVNGSSGIAVGMATSIPPHNLSEICDAIGYLIDNHERLDDIGVDELMRFVKGPDFPTGGLVHIDSNGNGDGDGAEAEDPLRSAYAVGRGRITVQAKTHIEEMSRNRNRIVVTELPYQVNKSRLIERIAELVRDGRLEGITDLRDESDRQGMRMIIELTRNVEPKQMLKDLFRLTPMRSTFSIMLLALVDGEPRTLSLRRLLFHYIEHRRDVIVRRSEYDLERARERAHILEGLLVALNNLDEVIQIIRRSRTAETAHANLRKRFKLTDVQAQAILDMPLRRLAALERQKIEAEYKEKLELIAYLEDLLAHPAKILALIKKDMLELKDRYGDARRTQIIRGSQAQLAADALLPDENNVFVFGSDGVVWREPAQHRYRVTAERTDEVPRHIVLANTRDTLLCLTGDGRALPTPAHLVPPAHTGEKKLLKDLVTVGRGGEIASVVALPLQSDEVSAQDEAQPQYLMTMTVLGKIKRTPLAELRKAVARGETAVMNVDENDRLVWATLTPGGREIILVSASAKAIRFNEEEIRPSGLGAGGVMAMKLDGDDRLIGWGLVKDALLLTVSQKGYGKVSELAGYPAQKRYGGGVMAGSLSTRSGSLVAAAVVEKNEEIIVVTEKGAGTRLRVADFPNTGRAAIGRAVTTIPSGQVLTHAVFVTGDVGEIEETVERPPQTPKKRQPTPKAEAPKPVRKPAAPRARAEEKVQAAPVKEKAVAKPTASARPARAAEKQVSGKPSAKTQDAPKTTPAKPASRASAKAPESDARGKPSPAAKEAAGKKRPEAEMELEIPVVRRRTPRASAGEGKVAEPAKRSPTARSQPAEDVLELPVKRRSSREQLTLPLEDQELDLPAPVKKPRRGTGSAAKPQTEAKKRTQARADGESKSSDGSAGAAKGKSPRRSR